jgi:hypothetical protein
MILRKLLRYQMGNHEDFKTSFLKSLNKNSSLKRSQRCNAKAQFEGQTIQWPKDKGQNDLHTTIHKTKEQHETH